MRAVALLKSTHAPARFLLRNCPFSFFAINAYLQTADRQMPPNYGFIADRVREGLVEIQNEPADGFLPPPAVNDGALLDVGMPMPNADEKRPA